jgi:phospho-N-acetylmuramoyl-pentapeptide-transferase
VISIMLAGLVGLGVSLLGTPLAIRFFRQRGWGQLIREEGPKAHYEKRGTPTMGGLVILVGALVGYLLGHFGLQKRAKFLGQLLIAAVFGWLAVNVVGVGTDVSFFRSTALDLGIVFFVWVFLMIAASSNGVNLTDGLDGLAVGSSAQVLAAFVVVAFWQFRHQVFYDIAKTGSDPFDVAILAAALFGACAGFLWWNTAPAKIFMGDTGSLMLGGAMAVLAILLNTQLLLIIMGGLYVVETLSVIAQVAVFRRTGKRIFLMAPIHHHFELAGWPEFTVIVRFWVLSGLSVAFGLGLFYADFLSKGGLR